MEDIKLTHRYKDIDAYKEALRSAPKAAWIKERDLGQKKHLYVPLYVQEAAADLMFRTMDVVEENYQLIANEIVCTLKIMYLPDYPNAEERFATGSASKAIQQKTGSGAENFPKGKITNSIEYNLPAARSAAISNAIMTLGNVFGKNIGRKTKNDYSMQKKKENAGQ